MSRYPKARWRPTKRHLPGGSSSTPMDRHDGGVDHTFVGSPSSDAAFAHFNTPDTPTPHLMFYRDGSVDQYIDTDIRSSACLDGNHRVITWETADGFPSLWSDGQAPKDTPELVQSKAEFMVWLNKEHKIPLVRMPSSKPTARGMGWHRLGIDGNFAQPPGQLLGGRVPGGEHWSASTGKTCPTDRRIHQFVDETLPLAVKLAQPEPPKIHGFIWVYNFSTIPERQLPPAQARRQAQAEANAILRQPDTLALLGSELSAYPNMEGTKTHPFIRDLSSESRANIGAWVKGGTEHFRWVDHKTTWSKTNEKATGQHPPRSDLIMAVPQFNSLQLISMHIAPKNADTVLKARQEHINSLADEMGRWADPKNVRQHPLSATRPRLAGGDWNSGEADVWSAWTLAELIDGKVAAKRVLNAVARNVKVLGVDYPTTVGKRHLNSDHGHALRIEVEI